MRNEDEVGLRVLCPCSRAIHDLKDRIETLQSNTIMITMASYSIIPTKQSDESPTTKHLIGGGGVTQPDDAFSRYSNDLLRFKSLLLLSKDQEENDDDDDDDLDALATINRALSRMVSMSNLDRLNQGNGNVADASKRRRGNNSRPIQQGNVRKTRLSWELHPSLILHDFMLELEALDNGTQHVPDDEEEITDTDTSQVQEVMEGGGRG